MSTPFSRSLLRGFALLLLVLAMAALVMLGFWQLDRARHKQAMLDAVARVLDRRDPVSVTQALDDDANGFAWTIVSGHFEPPLLFLDNQHHQGRSGLRVFAPLVLPGQPTRLLVDLGWLPWPPGRMLPAVALPAHAVTLSGLLAPPPSVGLRLGDVPELAQTPLLLTRLDPAELSAHSKVTFAARVLRLDPTSPLGFARDLDVLPNTLPPARHRAYAAQWFALAAALFVLVLWRHYRRRKA